MSGPEDSAEDLDDAAMWRAMRERSAEKRAENREQSARILERAGVKYVARNNGAHLTVTHAGKTVDFWPGTGKWIDRFALSGRPSTGRGVFKLLKHLGVSL